MKTHKNAANPVEGVHDIHEEDWSFLQGYAPEERAQWRPWLEAVLRETGEAAWKGRQLLGFFRAAHWPEIRRNLRVIRRKNRDRDTAPYRRAVRISAGCLTASWVWIILLLPARLWPDHTGLAPVLVALTLVSLLFSFIWLFQTERVCRALIAARVLAQLDGA